LQPPPLNATTPLQSPVAPTFSCISSTLAPNSLPSVRARVSTLTHLAFTPPTHCDRYEALRITSFSHVSAFLHSNQPPRLEPAPTLARDRTHTHTHTQRTTRHAFQTTTRHHAPDPLQPIHTTHCAASPPRQITSAHHHIRPTLNQPLSPSTTSPACDRNCSPGVKHAHDSLAIPTATHTKCPGPSQPSATAARFTRHTSDSPPTSARKLYIPHQSAPHPTLTSTRKPAPCPPLAFSHHPFHQPCISHAPSYPLPGRLCLSSQPSMASPPIPHRVRPDRRVLHLTHQLPSTSHAPSSHTKSIQHARPAGRLPSASVLSPSHHTLPDTDSPPFLSFPKPANCTRDCHRITPTIAVLHHRTNAANRNAHEQPNRTPNDSASSTLPSSWKCSTTTRPHGLLPRIVSYMEPTKGHWNRSIPREVEGGG
uniref:Uncharacterized protein n=1 Tax=Physcomitrium patens TaxID=3218 RepID=A0A7I4D1H7_PHYPA